MTVRVPIPGLREGEHPLGPPAAHYLVAVHRLRVGDTFVAFDPKRGLEAEGTLVDPHVARFAALVPARLVAASQVTWVQALPKGEKMDGIVRDATELGVTRIVPVRSEHVVVKLDPARATARRERWTRIAEEAARQCGRSDAPVVLPVSTWQDALEIEKGAAGFCLYEKADVPIGIALREVLQSTEAAPRELVFAAGPEGGLSPREVDLASERAFAIVSLGPFTLRAETVVAATLGAVLAVRALVPKGGDPEADER
jgi:16S rRNA (uracil1498-N3)-methyltransferase